VKLFGQTSDIRQDCSRFEFGGGFSTAVCSSGLDKFPQERKRITARGKNSCQMFFLLGDN